MTDDICPDGPSCPDLVCRLARVRRGILLEATPSAVAARAEAERQRRALERTTGCHIDITGRVTWIGKGLSTSRAGC